MYDTPFSFLFLALSGDSSDEDGEEDGDGADGADEVVVVVMSFLVSRLGPGIRGVESYPACA